MKRVLPLLLLLSCTPPALVLQREARTTYRRAQAAEQRSLNEDERQRLGLCQTSTRRAEALSHATYPEASAEAKAARDQMRSDCAAVDSWGGAVVPDRAMPAAEPDMQRDLKPENMPDMGTHDGGMDR